MSKQIKKTYGIKFPRPKFGFMFNVEKGLNKLKSHKQKSVKTAYLLAIFLGPFGAHHFYLNRWFMGVVYLLTFGIFGVGWIIDLFRIRSLVEEENDACEDDKYKTEKTVLDSYLVWFPFGIIGWHHFYLKNFSLALLYLLTFGVYGIGWVLDGFFMPSLVEQSNTKERFSTDLEILKTYLIAASPFGILGAHQYYSGRILWGLSYTFTLGGLGIWWLFDLFRISALVHRRKQWKVGVNLNKIYADDVYLIWIWFGILGGHHFYLRRYKAGFLYLFTLGCFGIGWLVDLVRIPWIVRDYNLDHVEQDEITFSDAFMESLSDFDRQELQRAIRRARYSGDDNSVFENDDGDEIEVSGYEFSGLNSSLNSSQRPKFDVGSRRESTIEDDDKNVAMVTTVAIISSPDESVAASAKTDKSQKRTTDNNESFGKGKKSKSQGEKEKTVILNPALFSALHNIIENGNHPLNASINRSKSIPARFCNESNLKRYSNNMLERQPSEHKFQINETNHIETNTNHNCHSANEIIKNDMEATDLHTNNGRKLGKSASSQSFTSTAVLNRVKSDAGEEDAAAKRKRKLLMRSNTQVAGLLWYDPHDAAQNVKPNRRASESEINSNSLNSNDSISTLPRVTKIPIRAVKRAGMKRENSLPIMSSAQTQTFSRIDEESDIETNVQKAKNILPNGRKKCHSISEEIVHIVSSASLVNVFDDVEEIPTGPDTSNKSSSNILIAGKDTGIGLHNAISESRPITKRSMSFPSRQISFNEDTSYQNGKVLIIDDGEHFDNSKSLRRSSTQSGIKELAPEENTKLKKRRKSFIPKLTKSKSDAHTPVMKLDVPNDDETTHEAWSSSDTNKAGFLTIK
ncbi:uncharacterized protein LOC134719470 [Mytilus trossulus]|uniref:uncharacterized protein LOC134719470 n=1 Tax=Mytilus trossulus TaxID=6551 RepID=UPI003006A94E